MAPPEMSVSLHLKHLPVGSYQVTVTGSDGTQVFYQKVELPSRLALGGGNPLSQIINTAPTAFPNFKKLPGELRTKMWEFAMQNEPRLFVPTYYSCRLDITRVKFSHKPPPIRQVCSEARNISNKRGQFIFGNTETLEKSLWFDPYSDIILDCTKNSDIIFQGHREYADILSISRNVAIYWKGSGDWREEICLLLDRCRSCQTMFLVQGHEIYNYEGDTALFAIPDGEIVTRYGLQLTCIELKEEIGEAWRDQSSLLEEYGTTEASLPSVVVADARPVPNTKGSKITI